MLELVVSHVHQEVRLHQSIKDKEKNHVLEWFDPHGILKLLELATECLTERFVLLSIELHILAILLLGV